MAETSNTAIAASQISDQIFSTFGWKAVGPKDVNFECVTADHPEHTQPGTHPADVVFEYIEPYEGRTIYVHTDLKSYAKDSIAPGSINAHLSRLIRATDCTSRSSAWQDRYVQPGVPWRSVGMLFVFNHDNAYDGDFRARLEGESEKSIPVPLGTRAFVMGPEDIRYLATVSTDMNVLRGQGKLPPASDCGFHYPHLFSIRARHPTFNCATIETLLGPWIVIRHEAKVGRDGGCTVYMRGIGDTVDEFRYLFDYLFRVQLVDDVKTIEIRMPNAIDAAQTRFNQAKEAYASGLPGQDQVLELLGHVQFKVPVMTVPQFRLEILGRERG